MERESVGFSPFDCDLMSCDSQVSVALFTPGVGLGGFTVNRSAEPRFSVCFGR